MGGGGSLARSLRIQGRVLHALLMREVITRFGRDNLGVLWIVAEPVAGAVHVNDQVARPVAGRQVAPPSTETSTRGVAVTPGVGSSR